MDARISCSHVTYQPALTMDFGMILIVGAAFSGKSAYARRLLEPFMEEQGKDEPRGSLHADMEVSGDEPQGFLRADPEASGCDKVSGPDLFLTEVQELADCSMDEPDIKALADSLCRRAVVLTASETGAGIVPVDADMRRLRENQGRLLSELSERADCVVRVFYGIPEVIKGQISEALSGCRECAAESS